MNEKLENILEWILTGVCICPGLLLTLVLSVIRCPVQHAETSYLQLSKIAWVLIIIALNILGYSLSSMAIALIAITAFLKYDN